MIVLTVVAFGLALFFGALAYTATKTVFDGARITRERSHSLEDRHGDQVARLVADMSAERREWAQERAVLLNRIQDPAGTAFTSNVLLTPPNADVSMEITH